MIRSRRRAATIGGVAVVLAAMAGLVVAIDDPSRSPADPYDHGGFSEVSVATETVVAGQARTATEGLRQRGYWCVQARSNDRAVQIACQSPQRDVRLDLVAAPDGDVLYADLDLAGSIAPGRDTFDSILDASLLALWPQDRQTVADLVEDAQPRTFFPMGQEAPPDDPDEQYSTQERRGDAAEWSLWARYTGEPLAVRVRTDALTDRSWPLGGRHYVTSLDDATAGLLAAGFDCGATSCSRTADGQMVTFDSYDGDVLVAHLTVRSGDEPALRRTDPSGQWVRDGLPFLTPAVRVAVSDRIEASRLEHRSWHGVLAGTPVDIVAEPGGSTTPYGRATRDLTVTIGIPLVQVD